jgi:hypothetical protein
VTSEKPRRRWQAEHEERSFVIEEDNPDVGFYLYVYDGGRCVRDELQDDIAICKDIALRDYGVPRDQWIEKQQ